MEGESEHPGPRCPTRSRPPLDTARPGSGQSRKAGRQGADLVPTAGETPVRAPARAHYRPSMFLDLSGLPAPRSTSSTVKRGCPRSSRGAPGGTRVGGEEDGPEGGVTVRTVWETPGARGDFGFQRMLPLMESGEAVPDLCPGERTGLVRSGPCPAVSPDELLP